MTIYGKKIPYLAVLLAGAGVCFVFIFGATRSVFAASRNLFNGSTCGTYVSPPAGGADDPGVNPPFAKSGEVVPACGATVCHYGNPLDCIAGSPTPPLAVASEGLCQNTSVLTVVCRDDADCNVGGFYSGPCVASGNWRVQTRWNYQAGEIVPFANIVRYWEEGTGPGPDLWKCFYDNIGYPECSSFPIMPPNYAANTGIPDEWISAPTSANHGSKYYYTVTGLSCRRSWSVSPGTCVFSSWQSCENDIDFQCGTDADCVSRGGGRCLIGHTPELRSEIRTVVASVDDYELAVAEPADTHVVTGGTSQQYTVTLTPIGTIAGDVALTVVWDVPVPNGVNIQWVGGSNTVNPSGPLTRSFTIQTTNNVTTADRYSFHIQGTHATAGDRITPAPNPTLTVQDYTMGNPSASPLNMNPTDSRPLTIDFAWLPAFDPLTQPVTLTNSAYPWLAVSYAPSPISSPAGRVTATLTTSAAPPGDYAFRVTGTAAPSGLVREVAITLHINPPPDFTISVVPVTATVNQGNAQTYTVTVTPINGFASPVTLAVGGLHASMTGTFVINPLPVVGPPASTTLTVTTQSPATPCGGPAYALTVTGTSGPLSHTAGTALSVNCVLFPDFSLAGAPATVTVVQGTPAVFTITATSIDGYINTVLLSCIAIGGCSFADSSLAVNPAPPPDETTLTIDTAALAIGNHPFQVQGSDGTLTHTVDLAVNVLAPPIPEDFAFDVTPNSLTFTEGDSGTFTVSVTPSGGFSQSVAVSWVAAPPLPASITLAPNPLTMNPGTQALQVQTNIGSAGTYTLDFTANSTTSTGAPLVKQRNGIQIFVNAPAPACGGGCPASQTCTPGGCVADPPADGRCNESLCYDSSGRFREPAPSGCWASWQPCNNFNVLKVRKDRQCNQWLDCVSSTAAVNVATGKTQNMCGVLGVCDQLGPDGQCIHYVSSSAAGQNLEFTTPDDVTGLSSKIRWYSGYSSGFHFKDLVQEIGGTIASTYPQQDIKETGLNGAQANDLVRNGAFEEMRCYGGKRDGLACITTSDCRVEQGVCADTSTPTPVSVVSTNPCESDADCVDVKSRDGSTNLNNCRYLSSWGAEVDCKNPEESRWLGVTPPSDDVSDNYEEAGFGGTESSTNSRENSVRIGQRLNENNTSSIIRWRVWEAEENFEDQTNKFEAGRSPRYPEYSFFKHLKDGNNILKVEIEQRAPKFSGVGVPVADQDAPLIEGGNGYVVSLKFKYGDTGGKASTIKAQLAFNYSRSEFGGYESYAAGPNRAQYLDFGEIKDATTEWKEYVFGPVAIDPALNYERSKTVFLNFVTAGDPVTTTFFLDDVSLKPALNTATVDVPNPALPAHARLVKLPRSCRLYPKNDAPGCEYRDANGTNYRGWRGYCLDKDPRNENLCLTWWPLDVLAGESLFGAQRQQGYTGRYPLFMCPEQEGGPSVLDTGNIETGGFENELRIAVNPLTSGNNICAGADAGSLNPARDPFTEGMSCSQDNAGARARIRWRDIEQIDVFAHFADFEGAGWDSCNEDYFCNAASSNAAKCSCIKEAHYWRLPLDHINPRAGDNGVKLTFNRFGSSLAVIDNLPFFDVNRWFGTCSGRSGDNQWLQALIRFAEPNDPDDNGAVIDGLFLKVCDDYSQGVWSDTNDPRTQKFRIIVRAKQSCNYLVQTVRSDNGPVEQAWATRLKPLSQYGIPDYVSPANPRPYEPNARYSNDAAPFGAVRAPANGEPSNWGTWSPNDQGAQTRPASFDFREPDSVGNVPRAGTPFSTRWPVPDKPKYCFLPIDYNAVQGVFNDYYGNGRTTKENNSCSTKAEIDACHSQNGICIGPPIGRCSLKPTISCSVDANCRSTTTPTYDYGTCSIYTPSDPEKLRINSVNPGASEIAGLRAPLRRLRDIFARSYGCWQYHTELVDNAPGKKMVSRYWQVPIAGGLGCRLDYVDSGGVWRTADWRDWNLGDPASFMDPFSNDHPQQCANNTRPAAYSPTAHCYVRPEIGTLEKPPTIGGATSGTVTIPQSKAVTAEFTFKVDPDQGPAEQYRVTWGGENCSANAVDPFIEFDRWTDVPAGNSVLVQLARYPATGTFRPKICVRDHWGVVGEFVSGPTLIIQ